MNKPRIKTKHNSSDVLNFLIILNYLQIISHIEGHKILNAYVQNHGWVDRE